MDESTKPLLDEKEIQISKSERKPKGKLSGTLIPQQFSPNITEFQIKIEKNKKLENKLIFKVYLHFFFQVIFFLLMTILSIKNKTFHDIVYSNKVLFCISAVVAFITLIYPLYSDEILKIPPYNYIYFLIFTISLSYLICKVLQLLNIKLVKIGAILFIIEILYLSVDSFIKKDNDNIINTSILMGLSLLFIGIILYFIEKISFFKVFLVILMVLLFGIFLIYDMNLIFLETRRKFGENEYVLATIFIYIDIFQTIYESFGYCCNYNELEKVPFNNNNSAKLLIFTGEKDYSSKYIIQNEIKRSNSIKIVKSDNINKESKKENDEDEKKDDKEYEQIGEKKLIFENKDENNN